MDTCQSTLEIGRTTVHKKYNTGFKFYNKKNFDSEVRALNKFKDSKYCIKVSDIGDNEYTMEKLDYDLGDDRTLSDNVRRMFFAIDITTALKMLDEMLADLKKFGVRHRDINPGNILFSEKEKLMVLTDFAWAEDVDFPTDIPGAVNHIYTTDDKHAIEQIKEELKKNYEKLEPEFKSIRYSFDENVGKDVHIGGTPGNRNVFGDYKDGSSIRQGWAYHIVDIPYFRDIPRHKETCKDEHNFIRSVLPITPKSFLDIGCSCGYHTFNFIRDFDIEHCRVFEADPAVNDFLTSVKKSYKLDELEIGLTFDDIIDLSKGYDVAIFLNAHMWVYKQTGRERTLNAMKNIINNTKYLFFQTAGAYSSSIFNVEEYKNSNDVKNMLLSCGPKDVTHLDTFIGAHGAPRDMFMVEGNK